jgi:hypothetical protein
LKRVGNLFFQYLFLLTYRQYGGIFYFTFTEAKVNDVIKGNGFNENDKIKIIQTKHLIEDPVLEKQSKKILF